MSCDQTTMLRFTKKDYPKLLAMMEAAVVKIQQTQEAETLKKYEENRTIVWESGMWWWKKNPRFETKEEFRARFNRPLSGFHGYFPSITGSGSKALCKRLIKAINSDAPPSEIMIPVYDYNEIRYWSISS